MPAASSLTTAAPTAVGSIESFGNVIAYASDFGDKWSPGGNIPTAPNKMHDNYVVFNPVGKQTYHSQANWGATNNRLAGPKVTLPGGKAPLTLPEWQAKDPAHHDVGSTWTKEVPGAAAIIAEARKLLD